MINHIEALKYKLSILDKTALSSEHECKKIEQQLQELTIHKEKIEKWIANISNNDEELKQIVKENVKAILSDNKTLLSISLTALFHTLKADPKMINIIYKIQTASGHQQDKDNNGNAIKYLESNKTKY